MVKKNIAYMESLHKYKERYFYKKNSIIFKEGTFSNNYIYFVQEGLIKIYTHTSRGNERILSISYPGEFIGMQGAINKKCITSAMAIENSVLYRFNFDEITELIQDNPELLGFITHTLTHNTNILLRNLYLDSMNAKQRLSYLILLYVKDFENDKIALTIADFTKYTGLTRVRVYQILKEWESIGIISIDGKHFYIIKQEHIEGILKNGE